MAKIKGKGRRPDAGSTPGEVRIDLHRAFIFPNRMRDQRRSHGYPKLLRLAAAIPEIPYIRLSKIERGEVVARPDEIRRIAAMLGIAPADLLLDIDAPGFDIAAWAQPFEDGSAPDLAEERFAVLLGAALRARRATDSALTIATVEREYSLPPVNLSRIENAQKPFARWNAATQSALYALFGVSSEAGLRHVVEERHHAGALDAFIANVSDPAARHARSRGRIAELAAALEAPATPPSPAQRATPAAIGSVRLIGVRGAPLPNGLIADTLTSETVEAPHVAGPRAFGLKVGRATLGGGLPSQATVIADPDRLPVPGGLAALREETGWRLLSVGSDRAGRMIGYSVNPDLEVALDDCDPALLAAIVSAIFV
ncbi:helix-turn-helix transcriptional regulator [Sphingomonas sp. JC676]|uniref:helix-turn-helix domain-containing protein n=1 Tax=Sphingomonas sp. JC676 TaxID=2768065 RepID=UPI0016577629|nr:helix-turn-helix transcriptional regulator [Sphingomonas sp. JC676]MBC9032588.1 helix-turn-helix transcriptional regulator [Sphingomonas sp. JC676]